MSLSAFLVRIIFLALPGLIASVIYRRLRTKAALKDWEDVIEIALFALLSYGIYDACAEILRSIGVRAPLMPLQAFYDDKIPISWPEIIATALVGIALSFVASFFYTHKLVNKLGRRMKVSRRFGDEDVWTYCHNMENLQWFIVRDHKMELVYYGWIQSYSDSDKDRELLLRDVKVYKNATSEFLYEVDMMYICRERYNLTIEVPDLPDQVARTKEDKVDGE